MSIREDLLSMGEGESDDYLALLNNQQAIETNREEIRRLLVVNDSLESLIQHLNGVSTVTLEHAACLRVTCENLLAGTGYEFDHSVLLPSLESYIGGTVSTESLKDHLNNLWKRLLSAIMALLQAGKRFWASVSTYQGRLRMSAQALAKQGAMRKGVSVKTPTVSLGIEIKALFIGASALPDADSLIRAVSAALNQYKVMTSIYPKGMLEAGKRYEELYKRTGIDSRQVLEDFCSAGAFLPFTNIATSLKALSYRDSRFGPRQIMMAPPTLGGFSLFIASPDVPVQGLVGNDLLTQAARQRTAGIKFAMTDVNANSISSGSMRTANGAQVEQLSLKVLSILDTIQGQESQRQSKRIASQITAVLSAAETFKGQIVTSSDTASTHSESVLRFARSYASWATGPVDMMTTNLLTVCRSILIYGRKSLKA